jgi:hypothetical protein
MDLIPFLMALFFISCLTIFVIRTGAENKRVIQFYLKLKIPTDAQTENIMNTIYNENMFNELIKKWTGYNNVLKFLEFQIALLISGFLMASSYYILGQKSATLDWNFFLLLIALILVIMWVSDILNINIFAQKKKGFWNVILFMIIPSIFVIIPMLIILIYITSYNIELNVRNFLSLYLVLTIGMYQSIKPIHSFFLPVSANGKYTTEQFIQEIIKEKKPECIAHCDLQEKKEKFSRGYDIGKAFSKSKDYLVALAVLIFMMYPFFNDILVDSSNTCKYIIALILAILSALLLMFLILPILYYKFIKPNIERGENIEKEKKYNYEE